MDEVGQPPAKHKRLRLNVVESVALSQSEKGSASLRNPVMRGHPAICPNRGMEPRYRVHAHKQFQPPRKVQTSSDYPIDCVQEGPRNKEESSNKGQDLRNDNMQIELEGGVTDQVVYEVVETLQNAFNTTDSDDLEREIVDKSGVQKIQMLSLLGGFTSATVVQKQLVETESEYEPECVGSYNTSDQNKYPWNAESNLNGGVSRSKGTNLKRMMGGEKWKQDSNQSTITRFMSRSSPSSLTNNGTGSSSFHYQSSNSANGIGSQQLQQDRNCAGFVIEPSEKIVYGQPIKMYSPIKKVSNSNSVYVISDESSPDCSQKAVISRTHTSDSDKVRSVSKTLFPETQSTSSADQIDLSIKRFKPKNTTLKRMRYKKTRAEPYSCTRRTVRSLSSNPGLFGNVNFDEADLSDFADMPACIPPVREEVNVGKTFGLLNDSKVTVVRENYFDRLPPDVVENIFCRLPMMDLYLNISLVCQGWNDVISDEKFIPWKKTYHKLKLGEEQSTIRVQKIMKEENMMTHSVRLVSLIRYVEKQKRVSAENNVCELLKQHPKYPLAVALLKMQNCRDLNPWGLICAFVFVASKVQDLSYVLHLLTSARSHLLCMEVLECFYCIVTFLLAFKRHLPLVRNINKRQLTVHIGASEKSGIVRALHYRLFYALYLYENTSVSNHGMLQEAITNNNSGQQSIVRYSSEDTEVRLTHEQMRIIKYNPNLNGEVIKIFAFAGTGKTTTLVRYAQMRPNLKFLLIVFNKSVCQHAQTKFPKNVTCKTGHGLAFGVTGLRYKGVNKLNSYNMRVHDIAMALRKRDDHKENLYVRAKCVMETLKNYLSSADDDITSMHAPTERLGDNDLKESIDHESRMVYASDAEEYWGQMRNLNNHRVKMNHDGYLKLYQLSKPSLNQYDIILVDEAQDLTPAMLDIIQRQKKSRIFVGDQHQQIYAFRGAVNAMQDVAADRVFYLTQSFRFGPEISHVANTILEVLKNESTKNLVGHGKLDKINGQERGQVAVLCRSNFTVFSEAVKTCVYSDQPVRAAFVGGVDGFGFQMLMDIYRLMVSPHVRQEEISNKFIAGFHTLADLEKYAKRTLDVELLGKIQIVKTFANNLPMCITKINQKCIHDITQADIVFSTVHKAKGLEFSTVKITNDFLDFTQQGRLQIVDNEEVNLLYVAVTRAKHSLIMSPSVCSILSTFGGGCIEMRLTEDLRKEGVLFESMEEITPDQNMPSVKAFKPQAVTMYKPKITLSTKVEIPHTVLSPALLRSQKYEFLHLFGLGDI